MKTEKASVHTISCCMCGKNVNASKFPGGRPVRLAKYSVPVVGSHLNSVGRRWFMCVHVKTPMYYYLAVQHEICIVDADNVAESKMP